MSRRLTTFVLTAFYLLQATWLLHAGVDLLLPPVREAVAVLSDSCCSNACGCPEDVKAAHGCCCVKHAATPPASKKPAPRSAIEEARCKGIEEAMTQALTQPVVCAFATIGIPVLEASPVTTSDVQPQLGYRSTRLEKVPIARA